MKTHIHFHINQAILILGVEEVFFVVREYSRLRFVNSGALVFFLRLGVSYFSIEIEQRKQHKNNTGCAYYVNGMNEKVAI